MNSSSAGSMSPTATSAAGAKRKSSDNGPNGTGQPHQRAKRNRYISIACNECKRRKIKCNGNTPCQRCGNLGLECLYAPNCCNNFKESEEFQQVETHIASLQDQVDTLYAELSSLRSFVDHVPAVGGGMAAQQSVGATTQRPPYERSGSASNGSTAAPTLSSFGAHGMHTPQAPLPPPSQAQPKHRFHGPTSTAFNFGVARSSLQTMGITTPGEETSEEADGTPDGVRSPLPQPTASTPTTTTAHRTSLPPPPLPPPPTQQLPPHPPSREPADHGSQRDHPRQLPPPPVPSAHVTKDPIWLLTRDEAVRLAGVWQDEMGEMYPVLDFDALLRHAKLLYTFVEAANRTGFMILGMPGGDAIRDEQTTLLKAVLAIALTLEGAGRSELGTKMFENVRGIAEGLLLQGAEVRGVSMLALTAMYHFHRDEEALAWRVLGLAARLAIELGLHQRDTYSLSFKDDEERASALRLFWTIYVLDRRWSFGTGMSFALHDADIDPLLPKPSSDTPYLAAMVNYALLGSKVWKSVGNVDASRGTVHQEELDYLDYQVLQWHRSLPDFMQYPPPRRASDDTLDDDHDAGEAGGKGSSRGQYRTRIVLYLRANQMRILIYRPVLHTATSIAEHAASAERVVAIARDTIRVLRRTNQTSDVYRTQQVLFHYFLISALAVLFLAVSHAPATFSARCRDEFYAALDLVRGLSADSFVSKRLWRTVRMLKEVGPKLGLNVGGVLPPPPERAVAASRTTTPTATGSGPLPLGPSDPVAAGADEAHSNAAVAMAGLAGHPVDELALYSPTQPHHAPTQPHLPHTSHPYQHQYHTPNGVDDASTASTASTRSPAGMANDLTNLFEAAGGYACALPPGATPAAGTANGFGVGAGMDGGAAAGGGGPEAYGHEEELAKIMRDLF